MSYEFIRHRTYKCRKEAPCHWCYEKILVGEVYHYESGKFEGDFQTHKFHIECRKALSRELEREPNEPFYLDRKFPRGKTLSKEESTENQGARDLLKCEPRE